MAFEISLITTREQQIENLINNTTLHDMLSSSYDSLSNLYNNFNDFTAT